MAALIVTLVCSTLSLAMAFMNRSDSKLLCVLSGVVVAGSSMSVATNGHWLWSIAVALNLGIIYFRLPRAKGMAT